MAPEQVSGDSVTDAVDQYGFGVVFFYAVSERLPFEDDNLQRLMLQKISAIPPPLSKYVATSTPALDGLLAKLLAKQPQKRFPSMHVVVDELMNLLGLTGHAV